jgi:hypothetical protein
MTYSLTKFKEQKIYITKSEYFAAIDDESYEKMINFIIEKDMEAIDVLMKNNKVIMLKEDLQVYLVKVSWGKVIIRPKGHDLKLWTVSEAIE